MFKRFKPFDLAVGDVSIHGRIGGSGPALLLLHGHPQTHVIWHRVADQLARQFTVVMTDLRGYGDSSKPAGSPDHANYSKRTMAVDQVGVMSILGFEKFHLLAHDRGARVAHRLCVDHPERVERAIFLDIAPTLDMYQATDRAFASAYFHWFLLIQPPPLPERLIAGDPDAYIDGVMGNRHAGLDVFEPEALTAYRRALAAPGTAHGICEDYRAANTIDLVHDQADRDANRRIQCPLHVLWGQHGVIERLFEPLALWRHCALEVTGQSLPCGHYLPEEVPEALLAHAMAFLAPSGDSHPASGI